VPYSSYADLIKKHDEQYLIQLSDDNGDGIADAAVIDEAIAQADAEINARVSRRYAVPMNPVPKLAASLSATLAVGMLYSHRGMDKPQTVTDDVSAAIKLLDRIGDGKAGWGEAIAPVADKTTLDVRMHSQARTFNRTSMKDF